MSSEERKKLSLPSPVLLEVRGPDAIRYLNGQVTQDVRLAMDSPKAMTACVTDAKGRLQFRVFLHAAGDGAIRVSCDHEGADELMARLDRYLIADDAALEDLTGSWMRVHVTGPAAPAVPQGGHALEINRIGVPGWDAWYPVGAAATMLEDLDEWSPEEAESSRIGAGIPVWGRELEMGLLPPEAGLDRSDISYSKGCYIGQEVISRIKSAGKVNRRLMRMSVDERIPCVGGDPLIDDEGRDAGWITSVAPLASSSGRRALLGYLRRSSEGRPVRLKSGSGSTVEVSGQA